MACRLNGGPARRCKEAWSGQLPGNRRSAPESHRTAIDRREGPRSRRLMRYLLFVLFLIVVIVFAHGSHRGVREKLSSDLARAAATALQVEEGGVPKDPRFRDVRFEVSHLDIILSGKLSTPETRDELQKRIREETQVGRIRYRDLMLLMARQPELAAVMEPGRVVLEGRLPTEDLAARLRRAFQPLGVFVTARDLVVDQDVNAEEWLNRADAVVARYFQGAKEGEFILRDGVLRLKRNVDNPMDADLIKAEMKQWLPAEYQVVADGLSVAETVRPMELAIQKKDERWILSGRLPDQPAVESIVQVIEGADSPAKVDASGVVTDPALTRPKWLQGGRIERFLKVFVKTVRENPEIIIRDGSVVLRGTASNFIAKSNLPSFASEAFGYVMEIDDGAIRLASNGQDGRGQWLRFELNPDGAEISGAVPSEEAKKGLTGSVARVLPGAGIKDAGLRVDASSPPMPWLSSLGAYLAELAALTTQGGTIDVLGKEVFLGGIAKTEWNRNALVGKLEQVLGPDFLVYDQMLVDPRGEGVPSGEAIKVYFGLGSRQVGKDQEAKIAEAAERINRAGSAGNVLALIKGYASPGGSAEYNIKLSEDRALAVYNALIATGAKPAALKILPEGVDPNLTGEEARRVEIFIR